MSSAANCDDETPIDLFVLRNELHDIAENGIQGWNGGKTYYVAGNTFATVGTPISIDNEEPGPIISEGDERLAEAFAAFLAVYGIDISAGP